MSSILKTILKGEAMPPPSTEAVRALQLRVEARPAPQQPSASGELGPQTRHHIEHLERQLAMERLRTKELRAQLMDLSAELAVLQEAGRSDLVEDYEGLAVEDVPAWVERVLLPAYGLVVQKLRGGAL
jgi:hypothetical protein